MTIVEELERQAKLIMDHPIDDDDIDQALLLVKAAKKITSLQYDNKSLREYINESLDDACKLIKTKES